MHYLVSKHEVLTSDEAQIELSRYSMDLSEVPYILYEDSALVQLRREGIETPIGSLVRIHRVRPRLTKGDEPNAELRTKIVLRHILEV
jgi:DNA-directed RNA polymerase subunit H (RpoH/RPB5)